MNEDTHKANHPIFSDNFIFDAIQLALPDCKMPQCDVEDVVRCMISSPQHGNAPKMAEIIIHMGDEWADYQRCNPDVYPPKGWDKV